jgi:predicted transcriptional regulator
LTSEQKSDIVLDFVRLNLGSYLRKIKKELNISIGTTQYQLDRLEKMGKIVSLKKPFYRSYYVASIRNYHYKTIMAVLIHERIGEILLYIIESGTPIQYDILKNVGITRPSVMWHLHRLINMNIIEELKHGKFKRYQLAGENRERMTGYILEIMEKYYPSLWDRWSSRITEFFQ